jgi:hypothetical protein
MSKNYFESKNIIWVTPENEDIIADGYLENIMDGLVGIAQKYSTESFSMSPKLTDIKLISGEVVEAVAFANFIQGKIELMGIFLYDYTKQNYDAVKRIVQDYFHINSLN